MYSSKMRLLSTTSLKMVYRDASSSIGISPVVSPSTLSLLVSPPGLGSPASSQSRDHASWNARVVNYIDSSAPEHWHNPELLGRKTFVGRQTLTKHPVWLLSGCGLLSKVPATLTLCPLQKEAIALNSIRLIRQRRKHHPWTLCSLSKEMCGALGAW